LRLIAVISIGAAQEQETNTAGHKKCYLFLFNATKDPAPQMPEEGEYPQLFFCFNLFENREIFVK